MSEPNPVIETRGLTRRFRKIEAVHGLDLTVHEGSIHAFLGPNGAGKTTTIRMLMNITHPSGGEATVLGTPSRRLGRRDFERIGYVSENQRLPLWMTVANLMNYLRPLYPTWDNAFAAKLIKDFDLPLGQQLKHLSRGMRMKASLVGALAFRPRLLILDEPFSGLDPLVREEFLEGIIELTAQEKWTIFISSHDIDEVERLADQVAIINQGRLRLSESVEDLLQRFRKVSFTSPSENEDIAHLPGQWMSAQSVGHHVSLVETRFDPPKTEDLLRARFGEIKNLSIESLSLREIYLVLARNLKTAKRNES
ncbi:MAG: ABC transporter ATP-binding protein [Verrucomicrobiae bacterium]|nr:ABC transporter ATP-binding protein [Verrucomicrobiae bacterium]